MPKMQNPQNAPGATNPYEKYKTMDELYKAVLLEAIKQEKLTSLNWDIAQKRQAQDAADEEEYRRMFFGDKEHASEYAQLIKKFTSDTQKGYDSANSIYLEFGSLTQMIAKMVIRNHPINMLLDWFEHNTKMGRELAQQLGLKELSMQSLFHFAADQFKLRVQAALSDFDKEPEVVLPVITHFVALDPKTNQFTGEYFKAIQAVTKPPNSLSDHEKKEAAQLDEAAKNLFRRGVIGWMESLVDSHGGNYSYDASSQQFYDSKKNVVDAASFQELREDPVDGLNRYLQHAWRDMDVRQDETLASRMKP